LRAFLVELGERGIDSVVQPPTLALASRQIEEVEKWLENRDEAMRREAEAAARLREEEEERRRAAEIERQQSESVTRANEEQMEVQMELEAVRGDDLIEEYQQSRTNSVMGSDEDLPAGFRAGTEEFEVPAVKSTSKGEVVAHGFRVSVCLFVFIAFRFVSD
jgi:hypothetical protein